MATIKKAIKKVSKAQDGKSVDPDIKPWMAKVSKQVLEEQKNPKLGDIRRAKEDSTMRSNVAKGRAIERADKIKQGYKVEDRPSGSTVYTKQKDGGKTPKDKKWIQKAVNPAHKGYCTPMTKATCTPKRKALAKTFKAMGKARKAK